MEGGFDKKEVEASRLGCQYIVSVVTAAFDEIKRGWGGCRTMIYK
jgi:hypothetical protein